MKGQALPLLPAHPTVTVLVQDSRVRWHLNTKVPGKLALGQLTRAAKSTPANALLMLIPVSLSGFTQVVTKLSDLSVRRVKRRLCSRGQSLAGKGRSHLAKGLTHFLMI